MAVVARGTTAGQAFARTVYAIAKKRFTGDFLVAEHNFECRVTWRDGLVVGAASAAPADSATRVALTAGLLTTTQVAEIRRRQTTHPGTSEVDLIAELTGLSERHRVALARRTMLQQAIRVFALPEATFELDDRPTLNAGSEVTPIAVRTLIFRGLAGHYDEKRLEKELSTAIDAQFQLTASDERARRRLAEYGFSENHVACVRQLAAKPMTVAALRHVLPDTTRKDILLALYALLATDDIKARRAEKTTPAAPTPVPEPLDDDDDVEAPLFDKYRAPPKRGTHSRADQSRPINISIHTVERARRAARSSTRSTQRPKTRERSKTSELKAGEVKSLLDSRIRALDDGADYYQLLGVDRGVTDGTLRKTYFELARKIHPDRLRALGLDDETERAQRLLATINKAFSVLSKRSERARYDQVLRSGGTGDQARDRMQAEKQAQRVFSAEEHFLRGEAALRQGRFAGAHAEFEKAVELNPEEAEHHALLAWTTWCTAEDKDAALPDIEKSLERALELSPRCVAAYFHRGQIAAARGEQERALEDFRKVLKLRPSHREADLQVRLLQSRMERNANKRGRKKSR